MTAHDGAAGRCPVFIGGAPRSGTTLVLHMLGRHSEIATFYETKIVSSLLAWLEGTIFNPFDPENAWDFRLHEYFERDEIYRSFGVALADLFGRCAASQGKRLWVEKTPRNVLQVDALLEMLPGLRFVHVVRDGRDVAVSMLKLEATPDTIPECARLWASYVRAGRSACRRHPECCLEIRYEELVTNPLSAVERLCAHLGVTVEPGMANIESLKVSLFEENWGSAAAPATPVDRWRRSSDFPKQAFKEVAGDLLVELGYEADADW